MIDVDIVLITFKRPDMLKQSLAALQAAAEYAIDRAKVRIHLLLNGVDGESAEIIRNFKSSDSKISLNSHSLERTTCAAKARNLLLHNCKSEWLVFVDDDAYVNRDYFLVLAESIARYPEAKGFGGPNLTPPGSTFFQKACGVALESYWGSGPYSIRYRASRKEFFCSEASLILCNLCLLNTGQRFEETVRHGEENLLIQRLISLDPNSKILYQPLLQVYHHRRTDLYSFIKQMFKSGYGRGEFVINSKTMPLITLFVVSIFAFSIFCWLHGSSPSMANKIFLDLYFLLSSCASFQIFLKHNLKLALATFALFPFVHASYVLGLYFGLMKTLITKSGGFLIKFKAFTAQQKVTQTKVRL